MPTDDRPASPAAREVPPCESIVTVPAREFPFPPFESKSIRRRKAVQMGYHLDDVMRTEAERDIYRKALESVLAILAKYSAADLEVHGEIGEIVRRARDDVAELYLRKPGGN